MKFITREEWGARSPKDKPAPMKPKRIVLHHSYRPTATQFKGAATLHGIQNYHMDNNGWSDIGYHFIVSPDGAQVFEGRAADTVGAHCAGKCPAGSKVVFSNNGSIGICLIGDYDTETPDPNAILTLQSLIDQLRVRFGIKPDQLFGHFECWAPHPPKTCPGKNLAEAMGMLARWKFAVIGNGIK